MRKDAVSEQGKLAESGEGAGTGNPSPSAAHGPPRKTPGEGAPAAVSTPSLPPGGDEDFGGLLEQLTEGTVVDGKYRIDQIIGRGAMGIVAAATHVHLRERVALKFLYVKANTSSEDFHSRFRREAQVSAKLRNEHITRVIDVGVWREKAPFMVMDYLEGRDLRQTLKAHSGPLPLATVIDYMVQVCEGMAEAHGLGIVHRDLKPSNLFVTTRPDGTDLIKILDFGISKWSAQESELEELTQTGVVLGSPKYMSPEQLFGSSGVDARADVWSIGAIFYELLAGRPPYNEPTLARICGELASDRLPASLRNANPELPQALEDAIFSCFVRDRDARMPNVAELAGAALDAVGAPFAANVRGKIGAMLDAKSVRDGLGTASGGRVIGGLSGTYGAFSTTGSLTGTGPRAGRTATGPTLPAITAPESNPPPAPNEAKASRAPLIAASVAAILFAGIALGGYLGRGHDTAPVARPLPVVSAAPIPVVTAPPAAEPAPVAAPPAAAAAPAVSTIATPAQAPPQPPAVAPQPPSRAYGGYRPPPRPVVAQPPTPAAAVAPNAPQTTAAPAPAANPPLAEPTKKPKVNPLEDRQ